MKSTSYAIRQLYQFGDVLPLERMKLPARFHELSADEGTCIDAIIAGTAGRVREFTPLRPAMEPWGVAI